ncbi:MAG TPA: hypothetical protein VMQ62_15235 [Dongiaceae bacterium]|nr:hypothetical protein [Dongiaceae bacterium]
MRDQSIVARALLCLVAVGGAGGAASAQTAAAPTGTHGWQHTAAIYMLAAGMSGKSAVGPVEADVDVSFSEILDHLQLGAMAAYRGTDGRWSVMVNSMFMGLAMTKDGPLGGSAEVDFDQTMLEVDGGWRFAKQFELYFGLRGTAIDLNVEVRPVTGTTQEDGDRRSWVDPLVGIRYEVPMGSKWTFVGRGDVGGFGVGSDFAWQAMAHFDWRISPHFGAAFGYVALDMDYEDGEGRDFFKYDMLASGPFAAATFHF